MELIIGTYSHPLPDLETTGEGIYSVSFDDETGAFGVPSLRVACANPSALVTSSDNAMLFAGREVFQSDKPGVALFQRSATGDLTEGPFLPIAGELPCHLAFDAVNNRLASAQYWTGDVVISAVSDGSFEAPSVLERQGSGPFPGRQEGPHAHFVAFSDGGDVLHVVDLGADEIASYRLNEECEPVEQAVLKLPPGSGPRHMVMDSSEARAWAVCELDETLAVLSRNGLGWDLVSVVPAFDIAEGEEGACAAIRLSPDEAHVYLSGRRQSQIAAFSPDGSPLGRYDCGGAFPREFIISPNGQWVIVANQKGNSLTSLRRDPATGSLSDPVGHCAVGSPIALVLI